MHVVLLHLPRKHIFESLPFLLPYCLSIPHLTSILIHLPQPSAAVSSPLSSSSPTSRRHPRRHTRFRLAISNDGCDTHNQSILGKTLNIDYVTMRSGAAVTLTVPLSLYSPLVPLVNSRKSIQTDSLYNENKILHLLWYKNDISILIECLIILSYFFCGKIVKIPKI